MASNKLIWPVVAAVSLAAVATNVAGDDYFSCKSIKNVGYPANNDPYDPTDLGWDTSLDRCRRCCQSIGYLYGQGHFYGVFEECAIAGDDPFVCDESLSDSNSDHHSDHDDDHDDDDYDVVVIDDYPDYEESEEEEEEED